MQEKLSIENFITKRPKPKGIDVFCGLKHFSIITYAVPIHRFEGIIPERFKLNTIVLNGIEMGLISIVPFIDIDFTSAVIPLFGVTMGQTNYRIYVIDKTTEERCVWFLGTTLDSWTIAIPRYVWSLPWHRGKISFDCKLNESTQLYDRYKMQTKSHWAEASVELTQSKDDRLIFPGFPDKETALVTLTHPLTGYYHRRDGKVGSYKVWHDALNVQPASIKSAKFKLLDDLNIVPYTEQLKPYSVLIEAYTKFTIYLPPRVVSGTFEL